MMVLQRQDFTIQSRLLTHCEISPFRWHYKYEVNFFAEAFTLPSPRSGLTLSLNFLKLTMAELKKWKGSCYDGRSSVPQHVTITVEPSSLRLRFSNGATTVWPFHELRQIPGQYSAEEVRIERGGVDSPETLVIPSADILSAIHAQRGARVGQFRRPPPPVQRVYWVSIAVLTIMAIIYGMFTWGIPWLARPVAAAIPLSWEIRLGHIMHQTFTANEQICDHPRLTHAVHTIMTALTDPMETLPYQFRVTVVDKPLVNAMAAPGGYVTIYRGLLENTDSPEELAGVLAHETQHVLLRHSMHLIVQHVSAGLVLSVLSGDGSGMATYALQALHTLQTLSYSRTAEYHADEQGFRLLQQAGIHPKGILAFFLKLKREPSGEAMTHYLSTHPATDDRLAHLTTLMSPHIRNYRPLPFQSEWAEITTLCQ